MQRKQIQSKCTICKVLESDQSTIGHFWGPYKYHCFRFQPKVRNKISLKIAKNRWPIPLYGIWKKKSGNEKWHFCYEVHEKNSSNRNATGYKWVLVTCWASTNTHLYHVALRFDEFFSWILQQKWVPFSFPGFFPNPIQWNWSWNFWCFKEILVFTFGWNLKQWYL